MRISALKIDILAISACLLWSTAYVGLKIGLKYWGPLTLAGVRFIISGVLLLPFWITACPNTRHEIIHHWRGILLVAFLQTFMLYGLFNCGVALVPAGIAAIVTGISPLTMAVIAHWATHDDKLSWRKMLCLATAFAGIIAIAANRQTSLHGSMRELLGMGMLILAGVSGAFGNLVVRNLTINPFTLTSIQIFIGGVLLLFCGLWLEGIPQIELPLSFFLALGWLALLSAGAFSIWFYLLQQPGVRPSELNIWKFIIPVFGAVSSWLWLPDESPTVSDIIGMLCVSGALLFFFRQSMTTSSIK